MEKGLQAVSDISDGGVNTVTQTDLSLSTIVSHYSIIEFATKEDLYAIIPKKAYVNTKRALTLLICLYLKPSTIAKCCIAMSSDNRSTRKIIAYLKELGYLSENIYYWRSAACEGFQHAVRYSVNDKGKLALNRFINSLTPFI